MPEIHPNHAPERTSTDPDALARLVYELLDAHDDTSRLAAESAAASEWDRHLAYLRDLQRVGREQLAGHAGVER